MSVNTEHWQTLLRELDSWQKSGSSCRFWWRDDDLVESTPELDRMCMAMSQSRVPVLVAVIPSNMAESLGRDLADIQGFVYCQHGYAHHNHALHGEPNSEYPLNRRKDDVLRELKAGSEQMVDQFGGRFLPVLVPPWNRFPDEWLPELARMGFAGISQYGDNAVLQKGGLLRIDTHLDVVDWTVAPRFPAGRETMLIERLVKDLRRRRQDGEAATAPYGLLTHHRAMDEEAWHFVEKLFATTRGYSCVDWTSPEQLFCLPP